VKVTRGVVLRRRMLISGEPRESMNDGEIGLRTRLSRYHAGPRADARNVRTRNTETHVVGSAVTGCLFRRQLRHSNAFFYMFGIARHAFGFGEN
jgi:hypothetical protein